MEARAVCSFGNVLFLGHRIDHAGTLGFWESAPSCTADKLNYQLNWLRSASEISEVHLWMHLWRNFQRQITRALIQSMTGSNSP